MKKHKHEALILEWLQNGIPKVEVKNALDAWNFVANPQWCECYEYRLVYPPVYPPKAKKHIKMLCWYKEGRTLTWQTEDQSTSYPQNGWQRVPTEDKIIEVEE